MDVVSAETARRMLLGGQGLLADPARKATPAAVYKQIERMGFVQVDTINIIDRAHHHILRSRFDGYRPAMLEKLLERDRKLFEHWTHDASIIPTAWFAHWRRRFRRYGGPDSLASDSWWTKRMGGRPRVVLRHVRERIDREGALMSRDFEHEPDDKGGPWWGWKPKKAALEYLWRTGELSVSGRVNFNKVYDLTKRVIPAAHHDADAPRKRDHADWACTEALERLGVATPSELAAFFNAVDLAEARAWCNAAVKSGRVVEVEVEAVNGAKPRKAVAFPDWKRRAARLPDAPDRIRPLSPFDPVIRDRNRCERLFGFAYRFEAFVPAPKRTYGYYVLPLLEGDRIVGRLDAKLDRERGVLLIKGLWWEDGVRATKERRRRLATALEVFAESLGAERVELP